MHVSDRSGHLRAAARISVLSSAISLVLSGVAIALAAGSGSLALAAFGLESLIDAGASAVLVWRFGVERREPHRGDDIEHRARRLVGFVLIVVAAYLAVASIRGLVVGPILHVSAAAVVLAGFSVLVLPAVAHRKLDLARRLGSHSLRSDGLLTAGGAVLGVITLAAVVLARFEALRRADPVAALVVAVVLLREATAALRDRHAA
jgi:divalent metal cation (Fe/Co/Zn/Cd) transporter